MNDEERINKFIELFEKAEKKYKPYTKRLAAEGWKADWMVLISTIMSAQNRDERTIEIGEELFKKYPSVESLAVARYEDVLNIFRSLNYNKTKAKHVVEAARYISKNGIPDTIEGLLEIPGVGRKTANLVLSEVHQNPAICVDTHVHRICNVFGIVNTKNPDDTERELKKIIPKEYWSSINRYFVLWGQEIPGYDKDKLLEAFKS